MMSHYESPPSAGTAPLSEDPLLRSARREALVVGVTWVCAMSWSVGYCAWFGYGRSIDGLTFVWGIPDWVFWGIVAPWLACIAFSFFFGARFMGDDDLGRDDGANDEPSGAGA